MVQDPHPERAVWQAWLDEELVTYVDAKFNHLRPVHDKKLVEQGVGPDSYWFNEVMQYLHRADVLGLDTPRGKQAVLKSLAAHVGLVESVLRVHGQDVPAPGVGSGIVKGQA